MPGFLGGSTGGGGGTGGEIRFPKEFIDPVTKLRVSQPENLIDTDFEYGLQPTKWETVELINNTPSFFSKSGDTTIPNIISITTNAGTREITVKTTLPHGIAVGIPIQVTGTKSVTADGSYIVNSIPNTETFTYLCKANQPTTASIEDLYSSILTGEFFQGAQLRIADASGIVTNNEAISTLTVTTESAHGFKANTPFYFLNLNSTISQEFQASNTAAKSFDSTNSAVAQTFDGSNTLSSINIDWSNSATVGGVTSNITVNTTNSTIIAAHGTENFVGQPLGTPLYYAITGGAGYFATNPRGVVFLKTTNGLGSGSSTFQVSATPDGDVIPITASISGTIQLANQARTFAGNNSNPLTQINLTVIKDSPILFDGGNQGFSGEVGGIGQTNGASTVLGYSDTILVSTSAGAGLDYYVGAMLTYSTTGSAATGLVNNETYFVASFTVSGTPNLYNITIKPFPTGQSSVIVPSGGTGTQTFLKIGVSATKDIVHIKNAGFILKDLVQYSYPIGGRFNASSTPENKEFYIISEVLDSNNYRLNSELSSPTIASGGVVSDITIPGGRSYRVHTFANVGTTNFVVDSVGSDANIQYLIVAGGGSGGSYVGGGGGAGGLLTGTRTLSSGTFPVVVGAGGASVGSLSAQQNTAGSDGAPSSVFGLSTVGGGGGSTYPDNAGRAGGSGGGGGGFQGGTGAGGSPTAGQGNSGGSSGLGQGRPRSFTGGAGGGGAGTAGFSSTDSINAGGDGGIGLSTTITGTTLFFAAGGGGGNYTDGARPGHGGAGGGGGGAANTSQTPGVGGTQGLNAGGDGAINGDPNSQAGNAGANTGSGGGGNGHHGRSGAGGSGIVVVRYPITPPVDYSAPVATGGDITTTTNLDGTYRIHTFASGTTNFQVQSAGTAPSFEYLIIGGGGGGGGTDNNQGLAGGAGAGGVLTGKFTPALTTYSIVAGGAGAGSTGSSRVGFPGGSSSAFGLTALGGGGGGHWWNATENGYASGGGGGNQDAGRVGGIGTPPQGNNGGSGSPYNSGANNPSAGGGGGGWRSVGQNANSGQSGAGGDGFSSLISGSVVTYSGGGGGGGTNGAGPGGGRGSGAYGALLTGNGNSAPNNRGGGGGAAANRNNGANTGGTGGSGIVIIRYPIAVN